MLWLVLVAYLCGSIPFGLLVVRAVSGSDLRKVGSGNIGATNVGRAVGKKWALIVLLMDALKGAIPTFAGPWLARQLGAELSPATAQVLAGSAAIIGHMFPIWLGFRGGKGVATGLGVIAVVSPPATLAAVMAFAITFALSRIVSLSSLIAAITFGGTQLALLLPEPLREDHRVLAGFASAIPLLVIVRHRGNIARLLRGEEQTYKLAEKNLQPPSTPPSGVNSGRSE